MIACKKLNLPTILFFNKELQTVVQIPPGLCIHSAMIRLLLFLFFSTTAFIASSQSQLSGKVYNTADSLLRGVTVFNSSKNIAGRSDMDGRFAIAATEGDTVIFTSTGYERRILIVTFDKLLTSFDVTMNIDIQALKNVTVRGNYQLDSLNRREFYKNVYYQPGITGRNTPSSGVGIVLSPLSYFSSAAKQKRDLKKRLIKNEREAYIDHAFPEAWVERMTGLKGDSLRLFLYRYRPSYNFSRQTDRDGMLIYINDRLREFRKPQGSH
jgi:hypothetical protein